VGYLAFTQAIHFIPETTVSLILGVFVPRIFFSTLPKLECIIYFFLSLSLPSVWGGESCFLCKRVRTERGYTDSGVVRTRRENISSFLFSFAHKVSKELRKQSKLNITPHSIVNTHIRAFECNGKWSRKLFFRTMW